MFSEHAATRPAPSNACEQSLGFVYIPIPILTAPPSRLVWSRPSHSPRPVTAQIRPVPSRPDRSSRLVAVSFRLASPRLASSRFATARPYRQCGRAVTLIDRYRVTKYGPRPFLLERALWKGRRTKKKKSCCPDSLSRTSLAFLEMFPVPRGGQRWRKTKKLERRKREAFWEKGRNGRSVRAGQMQLLRHIAVSCICSRKKKTSVSVRDFCSKKKTLSENVRKGCI